MGPGFGGLVRCPGSSSCEAPKKKRKRRAAFCFFGGRFHRGPARADPRAAATRPRPSRARLCDLRSATARLRRLPRRFRFVGGPAPPIRTDIHVVTHKRRRTCTHPCLHSYPHTDVHAKIHLYTRAYRHHVVFRVGSATALCGHPGYALAADTSLLTHFLSRLQRRCSGSLISAGSPCVSAPVVKT